ncbi:hypothetical protein RIR_jg11776.t1 [Rhizophagus irregularis DAOM 181602=DAOM 197198]|nr:hypothetical protein RIR_jg11776.t1 [Rhizophagus irregularis DAOM 181602=DAOM 197198]
MMITRYLFSVFVMISYQHITSDQQSRVDESILIFAEIFLYEVLMVLLVKSCEYYPYTFTYLASWCRILNTFFGMTGLTNPAFDV